MKNILNFFLPKLCLACGRLMTVDSRLCDYCAELLRPNEKACIRCALPIENGDMCGTCLAFPPPFDFTLAPFFYKPPLSTWVLQLKFQHKLKNAKILAEILSNQIKKHYAQKAMPNFIIPVPLHPKRLHERGFNQAIEIAKPIAKKYHMTISYEHFRRNKHTQAQSSLTARQRRINMSGAFILSRPFTADHVAILDDVLTTGQTVRVFSQMLRQCGVKKIDVWCCARVV